MSLARIFLNGSAGFASAYAPSDLRVSDCVGACMYVYNARQVQDNIEIYYSVADEIENAFRNDIVRFSSAMYVSIYSADVASKSSRNAPWVFISLYYASFFAAHMLLRSINKGIVFMAGGTSASFDRTMALYRGNEVWQPAGRLNKCLYDAASNRLTLSVGTGGHHECLWASLAESITEIRSNFNTSHFTRDQLDCLDRIFNAVSNRAAGDMRTRFSTLRNNVNYKFGENVWFPSDYEESLIARFREGWHAEDVAITDDTLFTNVYLMGIVCKAVHTVLEVAKTQDAAFRLRIENEPQRFYNQFLSTRFR